MCEYTVTVTDGDGAEVWSASGETYVAGVACPEEGLLRCRASSDSPSTATLTALACAVSRNVCESMRDAE